MDTADHKPGRLVPMTSPQQVREATVRDYKRDLERIGVRLSARSLERLAVRDLEMVDAYQRGSDTSPRPKKSPTKRKQSALIVTPEQARDEGSLPMKAPPPPSQRDQFSYEDCLKLSARWPFAMGRMRRILAGASVHRDPLVSCMTCEIPELAVAVRRLHANYMLRGRESRHNPFRGLSEADARRALVRAVEDICDRSSSKMGPWWVPK